MEKNYWIELIGFDKEAIEYSVKDFISRQQNRVDGVFLLLYDIDFVFDHEDCEYNLKAMECSYNGHQYNAEREIQAWTSTDLKLLIDALHENDVKVFLSVFNVTAGRDGKGGFTNTSTGENHQEIMEFSSKSYTNWSNSVHVLKRYKDGKYFEDVFAEKLKEVVLYYGFDGYHVADGISSGRQRIEHGDYSDDMVEQFSEYMNGKLPQEVPLKAKSKSAHVKRYKYILNNLRYEWTEFISVRFGRFMKKIVDSLHSADKLVYFNNTWTTSAFEAFFRYGVDYRLYCEAGADGMVFEDTGGTSTLLSYDSLMMQISEERRKYNEQRFMLTGQSLKLAFCNKIVNMTPLQDNEEQWNFIDNDKNEFRTSIARKNVSLVLDDNAEYIKGSQGSLYCLSDGLPKQIWKEIHGIEDEFDLPEIVFDYGFTAVFPDDYKSEVKNFIADRSYYAERFYLEMISCGLNISSAVSDKNAAKVKGAVIVFSDCIKDAALLKNIRGRSALTIEAGYNVVPDKNAFTFNCGKLNVNVYNVGQKGQRTFNGFKETNHSPHDFLDCHYPEKLRHDSVNPKMLKSVVELINDSALLPVNLAPYKVKNEAGYILGGKEIEAEQCNIVCYKTSDGRIIALITNLEYHFATLYIKFPFEFRKIKFLNKPLWHTIPRFPGNIIKIQVTQRNTEVLELSL